MSNPEHELERPKEAQKLERFLGEWRVEGTLKMESTTAKVSGTWKFDKIADGWGVVTEMDTEIEGMGHVQETVLIGYDSEQGKIRHFSMNRLAVRDHVGQWVDQDTLVVEYREKYNNENHSEVITIRFDSGQIEGDVVETVNGDVTVITDITLTRL